MRGNKRYTNVTFTKRVDYEGGSHRPAKAPAGTLVCRRCGSVYLKRRWVTKTDPRAALAGPLRTKTLCRACDMEAKGIVGGYLTVSGEFYARHRQDVERLLRNEAARAAEDNPLGRILRWSRSAPGRLTITTTTEHLAERLGRALRHAYHGDIDFGFSHGNKLARATWSRG